MTIRNILISFLFCQLMCTAIVSGAKTVKHTHSAIGESKTASIAIPVEKETYQALLNQLPSYTVEIDSVAIKERIAQRLKHYDFIPKADQSFESVAEAIYQDTVFPMLSIRVKRFNELMNSEANDDTVSVGFIAFTGLAKSMVSHSKSQVTEISMTGQYHYSEPNFEQGIWEWWDESSEAWRPDRRAVQSDVSGTTRFSRSLDGFIDEEIEFDLSSYGSDKTFTIHYTCEGKVEMEQLYATRYLWDASNTQANGSTVIIRTRPFVTVTAKRTLNANSGFRIQGSDKSYANDSVEQVIEFPATLEFKVTAEKY